MTTEYERDPRNRNLKNWEIPRKTEVPQGNGLEIGQRGSNIQDTKINSQGKSGRAKEDQINK